MQFVFCRPFALTISFVPARASTVIEHGAHIPAAHVTGTLASVLSEFATTWIEKYSTPLTHCANPLIWLGKPRALCARATAKDCVFGASSFCVAGASDGGRQGLGETTAQVDYHVTKSLKYRLHENSDQFHGSMVQRNNRG